MLFTFHFNSNVESHVQLSVTLLNSPVHPYTKFPLLLSQIVSKTCTEFHFLLKHIINIQENLLYIFSLSYYNIWHISWVSPNIMLSCLKHFPALLVSQILISLAALKKLPPISSPSVNVSLKSSPPDICRIPNVPMSGIGSRDTA